MKHLNLSPQEAIHVFVEVLPESESRVHFVCLRDSTLCLHVTMCPMTCVCVCVCFHVQADVDERCVVYPMCSIPVLSVSLRKRTNSSWSASISLSAFFLSAFSSGSLEYEEFLPLMVQGNTQLK
jgi:hypothetical protein